MTQSLDDEYFRFGVVSISHAAEHPQGKYIVESVRRSLWKPQKQRFAALVDRSLFEMDLRSPAGLYLGKRGMVKLSRKRINRVAERIVRGLFYHEHGRPVPENYEVANTFRQRDFWDIVKQFGSVKFPPWKTFGNDVFSYTFLRTDDDPDSIAWLQLFYGSIALIGFTSKPETQANAA